MLHLKTDDADNQALKHPTNANFGGRDNRAKGMSNFSEKLEVVLQGKAPSALSAALRAAPPYVPAHPHRQVPQPVEGPAGDSR